MGLRKRNFNIMGGLLKNLIFRRSVPEKPIYRVELPKKAAWIISRFKEGLAKKRGGRKVFLRVGKGETLVHTMLYGYPPVLYFFQNHLF